MALGLSFGKKKQTSNTTRNTDVTQTQNQQTQSQQSQTQQTDSKTASSTQTSTANDTRSQQSSTNRTNTVGTQTQTGRVQSFSDDVLSALESAGLGALARNTAAGRVNTDALNFNAEQFISDAVTQATAAASRQRGISEGGMADALGGTSRGNTMAALLAQEMAQQEAGAIAGARNQAVGQAQDIIRQNLATEMAAQGQDQGFMTQLLGMLQGGQQISTGETATSQQQSSEAQSVGAEQVRQQQNQQQIAQTQQMTQLIGLISELVSGTNRTVGRETENNVTRGSGGGIGLSL